MSEDKKCVQLDHENILAGSWGCCKCNSFNGPYREKCKFCEHARCYFPKVEIESTATLDELDALLDTELPDILDPIDKKLLN